MTPTRKDDFDNSAAEQTVSTEAVRQKAKDKTDTQKQRPWYVELVIVVLCSLVFITLIQTFVGRIYMIPSQSMEPTLHGCTGCVGDRIFVEKISYRFSDPKPGDVVVFEGTDSWNENYQSTRSANPIIRGMQDIGAFVGLVAPDENNLVKRIIASGGQIVQCQPGDPGIMVDGKEIDSSYILDPPFYQIPDSEFGSAACGGAYFGPVTVPEGNYFMMGDNRTNSKDSRAHIGDQYQGTIPRENIRGKVRVILFPFNRIGTVDPVPIQE
ncbi:signal peptidase I [Corynebacterium sp. sy039]|uniref:signal peptidase I n=1 Tax=Corynebacterium sp. sy039 TaxID=2599641 RepID=UPI0011B3D60F|nr:signal peptidase I [Corynebacterium sp. sy039]QDZ42834.1 signal peptidase I [Corynebacterium sp. sy039]